MNQLRIGLFNLLSIATVVSAVGCVFPSDPADGKSGSDLNGHKKNPEPAPTCAPLASPTTTGVGMANPAAVYCTELGYRLDNEQCVFGDGTSCEEWSFYRGECGQPHSFCNLHGGSISNKVEDMGGWTASYGLCTLATGESCQEDTFAHTCSCQ